MRSAQTAAVVAHHLVGGKFHAARSVDPQPIGSLVEPDHVAIHFHSARGRLRWPTADRHARVGFAGPRRLAANRR